MLRPRTALALSSLVAALGLAPAVRAGQVWTVDDDAPADFVAIQAAVDAAAAGDAILVRPGVYAGFEVNGKALAIVGDAPAPVTVDSLVRLHGVPPDTTLSVANLQLEAGLRVHDCDGEVRLTDCTMQVPGLCFDEAVLGSHRIERCARVVLARVTCTGREGGQDVWCGSVVDGLRGETGLSVRDSDVALYSCLLVGGAGGQGADGSCVFCSDGYPGDGGSGLYLTGGASAVLDDCDTTGGVGAPDPTGCDLFSYDSDDGEPVTVGGGATLQLALDPVLALDSATLVRDGQVLDVTVHGPPGTAAWLLFADASDWRPFPGPLGLLHCDSGALAIASLGTIGGSGHLAATFAPPPLVGGTLAERLYVQAYAIAPVVGRALGTPFELVVVDPAF